MKRLRKIEPNSGVYLFTNRINGKRYVGSSTGRKKSEETRTKMRKPKSEQARKNMAIAAVRGWETRRRNAAMSA